MELRRVLFSKRMIACIAVLIIVSTGFYIKEQNDSFYYERNGYLNLKTDTIELYKKCSSEQACASLEGRLKRLDVFGSLGNYAWIKAEDINNYNEFYAEDELALRKSYPELAKIYDSNPYKYDSQKYSMIYDVLDAVKAQTDYVNTYDEFLENIKVQAERMSSVSIFSKENSFSMRNIEKTLRDYEGLEGIELAVGIDEPVTTVMNYDLIHYLMLVFIIMLVSSLLAERKQGLWNIIHAASEGRGRLAVRRLGVIAVSVTIAGIFLYGTLFAAAFWYYGGISDIYRNVQSIEMFRNFVTAMPVWAFILLYTAVNIVSAILVAYIVWFIMSVISNTILAFAALGIVGAAEYVMYTFIPIQSNFSLFKCVNIFAYINPTDTLISYRNINFLSFALNRKNLCAVLLVVMIIVFAALCAAVNARKKPVQSLSKLEIFVVKLADRLISMYRRVIEKLSPIGFELYKILILQKGIFVIIILAWYLISSINTNTIYYSREDMLIKEFYQNYSGRPGLAVERYLGRLEEEVNSVYEEYNEASEQYKKGEITYDELMQKSMKVDAYSAKESVVYRIREKLFDLQMLRDDRGINGWLLDDSGYKCLFGENSKNMNNLHSLLAVFAVVLVLSGVFSYENKCGTLKLVRSVYGGRNYFYIKKLLTAVFVTVGIWLVVYGVEVYNIYQMYGLDCFGAPVQSLDFMYGFPLKINIGIYMFMVYFLRLVQLLAISGIVFAVSAFAGYEVSIMISTALLAVPGVLYMVGINAFGYISVIRPIGLIQLILSSGSTAVWFVPVLAVVLLGTAGYALSFYRWCVTGRRKNNA